MSTGNGQSQNDEYDLTIAEDMHVKDTTCLPGKVVTGYDATGNPTCADHNTSGVCGTGEVVGQVAADGTVTCVPDDTGQATISKDCGAGSFIRTIAADGTVTCAADETGHAPIS